MTVAERITEVCTHHGESPVWDPVPGLLRWVDMLRGDVLAMNLDDGSIGRSHIASVAACLRPRDRGGLVVAVERGFALTDPDSEGVTTLPALWSDTSVRMNDGGCDRQGRFYCGSMGYDAARGRGALYQLDRDGTTRTVLTGVTISNGLVWSGDGGTVFYIDSPTRRVDAFDFDSETATFSARRTVVEIPPEHGMPDGMTIDVEGGLWVALWGGGAVHRYTPDGRLDAIVELPVSQVSACAFAGPTLSDLYITTSREGVGDGDQPSAGALFRHRPGITGVTAATYAG